MNGKRARRISGHEPRPDFEANFGPNMVRICFQNQLEEKLLFQEALGGLLDLMLDRWFSNEFRPTWRHKGKH